MSFRRCHCLVKIWCDAHKQKLVVEYRNHFKFLIQKRDVKCQSSIYFYVTTSIIVWYLVTPLSASKGGKSQRIIKRKKFRIINCAIFSDISDCHFQIFQVFINAGTTVNSPSHYTRDIFEIFDVRGFCRTNKSISSFHTHPFNSFT